MEVEMTGFAFDSVLPLLLLGHASAVCVALVLIINALANTIARKPIIKSVLFIKIGEFHHIKD
jgi:hypothetical protein